MKILFLNPCPEKQSKNHLFRKFYSQINSAVKLGDDVYYTSYDEQFLFINHIQNGQIKQQILGKNKYKERNVLIMHQMMQSLRNWIKKDCIDLVYMRNIPPTYAHSKTKKMLQEAGAKICIEIPSYPGNEINLSSRKFYFKLVSIAYKLFSTPSYTNLYALIGEHADTYQGVAAINIENGLDVETIPLKNGFSDHPGEIHLLIVAVVQYWHGYDRLIKGIDNYIRNIGDVKIMLHICGSCHDGSLDSLLQFAREHGFSDNVIFHGYQSGKDLDSIFDKCDVAIGSLGLHRSKIIIDTTLKLPEYTARGIPFIYCTTSNNVKPDGKYYLRIPDDETDVDIQALVKFFHSINKKTVITEMREYAENNIQWSVQLTKVKNKIKEMEKNNG